MSLSESVEASCSVSVGRRSKGELVFCVPASDLQRGASTSVASVESALRGTDSAVPVACWRSCGRTVCATLVVLWFLGEGGGGLIFSLPGVDAKSSGEGVHSVHMFSWSIWT